MRTITSPTAPKPGAPVAPATASLSPLLLVMCLAATWLVWGSTYLAIKFALVSFPPFFQMGTRFVFAGALLMAWVRWRGAAWPDRRQWRNALLVGTLMLGGGMGGTAYAETSVGSGLVVAFIAVSPLMIAALNRLWGLNWPRTRLMALGLKLGADVPFFVGGNNAFVEGIGERLTPAPVGPEWLAVVKPAASIETRAIFGSLLLARNTEAVILEGLSSGGFAGISAFAFGRNDLQAAAEAACTEVAQAAELLQRCFGNSRMTGSGSAVFARVSAKASASTGAAEQPIALMPADLPAGWVGRMCRSLKQHPLVGWAED